MGMLVMQEAVDEKVRSNNISQGHTFEKKKLLLIQNMSMNLLHGWPIYKPSRKEKLQIKITIK